ncbi:biopolymer transporter ExbD [Citreicella sp. C3M06]|uniref:biopolymer transporter ExbD n=1 Tax=Citreicella sp. C3M06 TaxID=2841564 RepID=UPI001C09AD2C|nr:biopolymer transporter ExbD [Citreicella sp. C3M06]MBU2961788.1 biopolymer transporter ExbD [Citreicella sp. C3M06]
MRKARRRNRLSMTSLIDVIFLLLLFFMLSSTFSKFSEVELMAAGAGVGTGDARPLFLRLGPDSVTLNAAELTLDALPEALSPEAGEPEENRLLLVSLQPGVSAQRLTDLLVVLRRVPGFAPTILGGA